MSEGKADTEPLERSAYHYIHPSRQRIPLARGRRVLFRVNISRREIVGLVRFAKGQRAPCVGHHDVVIGGRGV